MAVEYFKLTDPEARIVLGECGHFYEEIEFDLVRWFLVHVRLPMECGLVLYNPAMDPSVLTCVHFAELEAWHHGAGCVPYWAAAIHPQGTKRQRAQKQEGSQIVSQHQGGHHDVERFFIMLRMVPLVVLCSKC
jgi:hypothetical protein